MISVAYLITHPSYTADGVTLKVQDQVEAWRALGLNVTVFFITRIRAKDGIPPDARVYLRTERQYSHVQVERDLGSLNPDLVYMRYCYPQIGTFRVVQKYPTVIELNGDLLSTMKMRSRSGWRDLLLYWYVRFTCGPMFRRADAFACVTHEVAHLPYVRKYRKPIAVSPNSICLDNYSITERDAAGRPRIAFIAKVSAWHGIDKLVHLARLLESRVDFDVIGATRPPSDNIPQNIMWHGWRSLDEAGDLLARADVGIDGLALYRKNMQEACPLKIRFYVAHGLPIILSCKETAFVGHQLPWWVYQVSNDPENVEKHASGILEFSMRMRGHRVQHSESRQFFDTGVVEKARCDFFRELVSTWTANNCNPNI